MSERHVQLFASLAAGKVLAVALGLATTTVLVGWLLGPAGLGQWTLLAAAGTLLHTALINWTHPSTVRYGREEWVRTHSLNRTLGARAPLLAVGAAIALLLVLVDPAQWLQRVFGADRSAVWMVLLFTLAAWAAAEAQATFQAADCISWQAVLAPAIGGLSALALLVLMWTGRRSLAAAVVAFTIFPIAGWGGAWVLALARSGTRVARLRFADFGRNVRYAVPLLPTFVVGYLSDWGDHLLLRYFSTVEAVGLFGISYQVLLTILAGNSVLTTLLLPRLIAQEVAAPGSVRTYVDAEVPTLYALWMIATVWVVAAAPAAVRLFTASTFARSVNLLLILMIVVPSSVVTSLYTIPFNVQERTWRLFFYLVVMTAANIAISLTLVPTYGAIGAAVGTAVAYAVAQALYVIDQHSALAVPAMRVWTLWAVGLALGVGQLAAGPDVAARAIWAVLATAVLIAIVRVAGCVDDRLVERLFAGRLSPVADIINRTLVTRA
jgi:O-antigen/teichoic acid export membrane protein